jgi:hypothetical protein
VALVLNCLLFFVVFLPLTFLVGAPFDFYLGRYQPPREAAQVMHWLVAGWPLFIPTILAIPLLHVLLAIVRRRSWASSPGALRKLFVAAFPIGLLSMHLVFWGDKVFSPQLLIVILVPGAVMGAIARIPKTRASRRAAGQPDSPDMREALR